VQNKRRIQVNASGKKITSIQQPGGFDSEGLLRLYIYTADTAGQFQAVEKVTHSAGEQDSSNKIAISGPFRSQVLQPRGRSCFLPLPAL
jgi:hypothetical protein